MEKERIIDINEIRLVQAQARFLEEIGLWETGPEKGRFAFRLSPDVLELNFKQKAELEEINVLMFSPGGFFDGANRLFDRTFDQRFISTNTGAKVLKTLRSGLPKAERELIKSNDKQMPVVCRLDLAFAPNQDSEFKILEVEGDKTHAFGLATIAELFARQITGDATERPPGLVSAFRTFLKGAGATPEKPAVLIVGREEMFYETELKIFAQFCRKNLIPLVALGEREVQVSTSGISLNDGSFPAGKNSFTTDLLINLPVLTPGGYRGTDIDADLLLRLFAEGKIRCLIPPKRFLGSKGLLALVSNGDNDLELEAVLQDCFDPDKLARLRELIPSTFVISKKSRARALNELDENPGAWVIKKSMSSGMRGVALPSGNRQRSMLGEAVEAPFNYVIQAKVAQETREFRFAEPNDLNAIKKARMFMRISPFCTPGGIATICVTGRETPDVHGATDSILISTVFKE